MKELASLYEVYANDAVRDFGDCLRIAIFRENDFDSLTRMGHAETPQAFAEVVTQLLRRNYKGWLPKNESLPSVMKLVDDYGPKLVRAAIVSHALTWKEKIEKKGDSSV